MHRAGQGRVPETVDQIRSERPTDKSNVGKGKQERRMGCYIIHYTFTQSANLAFGIVGTFPSNRLS
jgi:hypothetical protein